MMRQFTGHRQYREALAHVEGGGQALFLHPWNAPSKVKCFNGVPWIGKLFDRDRARLVATAKRLGVRVVKVDRDGQETQHVDLVARPLARAMAEAEGENVHV